MIGTTLLSNMSVTVILGAEPKMRPPIYAAARNEDFLRLSCPDSFVPNETKIVETSFNNFTSEQRDDIYPSTSSFVRSAIEGRRNQFSSLPILCAISLSI
jgi:hypothetical protein